MYTLQADERYFWFMTASGPRFSADKKDAALLTFPEACDTQERCANHGVSTKMVWGIKTPRQFEGNVS